MNIKHWLIQLFLAVDQLLNVLVTPFSTGAWADETLSSRAWRMYALRRPWGLIWRPVIDGLFFWQKQLPGVNGHCHGAYLSEKARYNLPPEMRQ
jgi:hypothetical protein